MNINAFIKTYFIHLELEERRREIASRRTLHGQEVQVLSRRNRSELQRSFCTVIVR